MELLRKELKQLTSGKVLPQAQQRVQDITDENGRLRVKAHSNAPLLHAYSLSLSLSLIFLLCEDISLTHTHTLSISPPLR